MDRVMNFIGQFKNGAVGMVDQQGIEVVINYPYGYVEGVDRVAWQVPAPGTDTQDIPVVTLTMSASAANLQNQPPAPAPEHYLPHGREPVMATLMVRSRVPVQLDLVVTPNVSITVTTLKGQKVESAPTPDKSLFMKPAEAADGRTVPA